MKKVHYSWLICGACALAMLCNMGLCSNILGVYLPFLSDAGITASQCSMIISIRCVSSFLFTFPVASFYHKVSIRTGLFAATLLGGLGTMFMAIGGSVVIYYLGAVILGIAYAFGTMIVISLLIGRWFATHMGTALGLCSMGSGAASILFAPIITANTLKNGLSSTFLLQGAFMILCAFLIYLIVRPNPECLGMEPYRKGEKVKGAGGFSQEDFRIPASLWILLLFMMFLMGGVGQTISSHVSIASKTAGYTATQCGTVASLYGLFLIIGKIFYGRAADRIGAKNTTVIFAADLCFGCALPLVLNGQSIFTLYLFASALGFGCAFFTVGVPLWCRDLSTAKDYEHTLTWFQILYSGGGIVLTLVPGLIADRTGEYVSSFLLLLALTILSILILLYAYRRRKTFYL